MNEPTTLIVGGRADHNPDLLHEMKAVADRLASKFDATPAAAWFDQGKPLLIDTMQAAVDQGSVRLVIVPFLLQWSYPDQYVLPDSILAFTRNTPDVAIHMARPIGLSEDSEAQLEARAFEALCGPAINGLTESELTNLGARGTAKAKIPVRPTLPTNAAHLLVCQGRTCLHAGALFLERAIRSEVAAVGSEKGDGRIQITRTRCVGPCASAPVVTAYPSGDWYYGLTEADAQQIVAAALGTEQSTLESKTYRPGTAQ